MWRNPSWVCVVHLPTIDIHEICVYIYIHTSNFKWREIHLSSRFLTGWKRIMRLTTQSTGLSLVFISIHFVCLDGNWAVSTLHRWSFPLQWHQIKTRKIWSNDGELNSCILPQKSRFRLGDFHCIYHMSYTLNICIYIFVHMYIYISISVSIYLYIHSRRSILNSFHPDEWSLLTGFSIFTPRQSHLVCDQGTTGFWSTAGAFCVFVRESDLVTWPDVVYQDFWLIILKYQEITSRGWPFHLTWILKRGGKTADTEQCWLGLVLSFILQPHGSKWASAQDRSFPGKHGSMHPTFWSPSQTPHKFLHCWSELKSQARS